MSESHDRAQRIIAGAVALPADEELKGLVKALKADMEFGPARKILAKAKDGEPDDGWIVQQLALCTYKDEELLPTTRFDEALGLLAGIGLRDPGCSDPETLALGGAVYKRMWEHEGQLKHLYQALAFYLAAWTRDRARDMGYGGVNAAYVLDVLASQADVVARRAGASSEEAEGIRQRARELREEMARELPRLAEEKKRPRPEGEGRDVETEYWYPVTLAEVHFGLEAYEEAGRWLAQARDLAPDEWQRQTTCKQLVSLARLQGHKPPKEGDDPATWPPPWRALRDFLGEAAEAALSVYRGKVGLALSGGGFRASLFHLGVLARLAEIDALRSVEVLSTVSGGSIVGAHYYLELQNLLQTKQDSDISKEDYILIVRRVQESFLAGVGRNLRMRTLSSLPANLRMIFSKYYSRSHRLGELYERELYRCIGDGKDSAGPRTMPQLLVEPAGQPQGQSFKPAFSNWSRRAKVPVLLLNTTSLNSGHAWHFTARWMGEPPGLVGSEVDVNERYRRLWYEQAPTQELRDYRLGYAVAASACVPGLFVPLALEGLYPGRTIRLVDGGVHDNQGAEGLLNEGCTLILASDASGQMEDQKRPSDTVIGVPLRSNSVLMDRVRESQFQDLRSRVASGALRGLFLVHLKKDLETLPIDWTHCQDPSVPPTQAVSTTPYGVDRDLQRKLAALRTDLDSFTEVEAHSLMLSGYLMTEHEFKELDRRRERNGEPGTWGDFDVHAPRFDWPFLQLETLLRQPADSSDARREDLGKQLDAGARLAFKIWKLSPTLKGLAWALGVGALVLAGWLLKTYSGSQINFSPISVGAAALSVVLAAAAIAVPVAKWLRPQEALRSYAGKAVGAVVGFVVSNVHLLFFNPLYLRRGRIRRLMELR